MNVKKYITDMIDKHQEEFGVNFDICVRDYIEDYVNDGVYAFQVIYNGHNQVHEIKNLNYSLLKSEKRENTVGGYWLVWSYDNGVRYQWNDSETLVFDPSVIRNIKLNQILN